MRRWFMLLMAVLLVVSVAFAAGCNQAAKEEGTTSTETKKEPLKVGAVLSLSGIQSSLGLPEKQTLEMLVDAVNEKGGIDGRKVELYIEDDQSDPNKAKPAVDKLISGKKVDVLIGGSITPVTLILKAETGKAKIPQVAPAAGIKITEPDFKNIFRTAQSDALAVKKVIEYMSDTMKIKKFAIISVSSAFGDSGRDTLKKEAPGAGLEVVGAETYDVGATDVTAQLTKLRATDAEAIVIWDTTAGAPTVVKNAVQLGIDTPLIGSHGIANKKFIELAGDNASKVVFPAGKILNSETAEGTQKEVIDEFVADFKAKYNTEPDTFAGHAYDAFQIIVQAAKVAGNDPAKLRDEIEKTKNFVGISGIFNYSADDHDGLKTSDLVMWKIENGKWVAAE